MVAQLEKSTPALKTLVLLFANVGVKAFGGALQAHLMHQCIKRGLLSEKEYLEALNWCQSLPGPNGTNLSAYLGSRLKGGAGAVVATVALVLPGALLILILSQLMSSSPEQPVVQGALSAIAAAAVGLIAGMVWQLGARVNDRRQLIAAALVFSLVGVLRLPVPLAILLALPAIWRLNKTQSKTQGGDHAPSP